MPPDFPYEPLPDVVLVIMERRPTPPDIAELGLVRVRLKMRSGVWRYDTIPTEAILDKPNALQP